jgi:16S rRNA (guanine527-N7)-methyltransferase
VTSAEFQRYLTDGAERVGLSVLAATVTQLETYFRLLCRWNARINLTSLPLDPPTAETFDRLLLEPLAAARFVSNAPIAWFDLGSGGGSPAIPLKIVRPAPSLTMVESRGRKASFLREAVRELALERAVVVEERFERLSASSCGAADLATVRGVRGDAQFLAAAGALLRPGGTLLWFGDRSFDMERRGLKFISTERLLDHPNSTLQLFRRMFHVEQKS